MSNPLSLLVTRRLPAQVERVLRERYDATLSAHDAPTTSAQLRESLRAFDIILCTLGDRFDRSAFAVEGRRTKLLANFGAGVNHIDVQAARECGVAVTNTPDVLTDDTADLTILLILAAMRRAREGEIEVHSRSWTGWRPTHLLGTRVTGSTLGIVGFGRIGQAVAKRAHFGLGMQIRFFSRSAPDPATVESLGAVRAESLENLLGECDVVSLHVPATAETRHLIDARALACMRPGAFLVNTARGDVVDEAALRNALKSGHLAGAGLDVFENEPAVEATTLALPNVFALPHIGSATTAGRVAMGMRAIANIDAFVRGDTLPDRVV